jgi:hypothetical protein
MGRGERPFYFEFDEFLSFIGLTPNVTDHNLAGLYSFFVALRNEQPFLVGWEEFAFSERLGQKR